MHVRGCRFPATDCSVNYGRSLRLGPSGHLVFSSSGSKHNRRHGTSVALMLRRRIAAGGLMRTLVIPRTEWRTKLDQFSSAHEGARVSVELLTAELGAQPEIANLPLQ